jgi:RimJ/RimL family protein N-acetyltransferase
MSYILKEVSLEQIANIVDEADWNGAFIADKNEPDFKVLNLLKYFEGKEHFHVFAFTDELAIAGFISLLPTKEEHASSIGPMCIRRQYQRLGLGKKQVVEVMNWAKNNHIKRIYTRTWGQNDRSRKIFEGLGFTSISETPDQRINGDSTVSYAYNLFDKKPYTSF